jgi:hypothetical protein
LKSRDNVIDELFPELTILQPREKAIFQLVALNPER